MGKSDSEIAVEIIMNFEQIYQAHIINTMLIRAKGIGLKILGTPSDQFRSGIGITK